MGAQVYFAEGSIHAEGADNVLVQTRPGSDLRSSHELHDMDNEIKIIEVFLGLLGTMCLCGCACVCYFRATKPKPLTDDDLDSGFGAVLQASVGPVGGVDPETELSAAAAIIKRQAGGGSASRPAEHNPLVVRPGDDAQLMQTVQNRLVARP